MSELDKVENQATTLEELGLNREEISAYTEAREEWLQVGQRLEMSTAALGGRVTATYLTRQVTVEDTILGLEALHPGLREAYNKATSVGEDELEALDALRDPGPILEIPQGHMIKRTPMFQGIRFRWLVKRGDYGRDRALVELVLPKEVTREAFEASDLDRFREQCVVPA